MTARQVLAQCDVFSGLAENEMEKIGSSALEREYEAGATIFQEGDVAQELLVLQEGKVALQMTLPRAEAETSRRMTVDVVNKNEMIGWSAIVEPYIYTMSAICLQKTKALSISGTKLRTLMQENQKVGYLVLQGLIRVVASRLNETRQLLVSERLMTGGK
ncbi:MAG: fnr 2 [Dehalococcoidales bacterium]|nr:fnr 2 [Dehalococcoidales bacterium]